MLTRENAWVWVPLLETAKQKGKWLTSHLSLCLSLSRALSEFSVSSRLPSRVYLFTLCRSRAFLSHSPPPFPSPALCHSYSLCPALSFQPLSLTSPPFLQGRWWLTDDLTEEDIRWGKSWLLLPTYLLPSYSSTFFFSLREVRFLFKVCYFSLQSSLKFLYYMCCFHFLSACVWSLRLHI